MDIEEFFAKGYLFGSNELDNSIELFDGNIDDLIITDVDNMNGENNKKIDLKSADEIVIVIPEGVDQDELVIDLDELGIDVENLDDDVNIIIQIEDADELEENLLDDEDFLDEPNEWFFDDDPYGIVYYEFPEEDD